MIAKLRYLLVLVAAVSLVACDDDDTDPATDTAAADTASTDAGDDTAQPTDTTGDATAPTDGTDPGDVEVEDMAPWMPDDDCTSILAPEDDETTIRTAFLDAATGDVICFSPGDYAFSRELSITVDGVTVKGAGLGVSILDFAGQDGGSGANGVFVRAGDFTIADLTVKNTPGDAIRVEGTAESFVQNIEFLRVEVTWDGGPDPNNGAYGLYPVQTENTLIDGCVASYASDAGVYVGQSRNVIVRNTEAYGNVAGIEIENTIGAEVHDNYSHDNTGGLLVFDLPDKPLQGGKLAKVRNNRIENNNQPNFASPGNIVASVPSGTGIIVLSSDENEFVDNTITGNETVGIVVVSYYVFDQSYQPDCNDEQDNDGDGLIDDLDPDCEDGADDSEEAGKADYDPFPENNHIHGNTFVDNGQSPDRNDLIAPILLLTGASTIEDMVWDGILETSKTGELRNCFNTTNVDDVGDPASWRNLDAENFFADTHTDITRDGHDCVGITVDGVVLP